MKDFGLKDHIYYALRFLGSEADDTLNDARSLETSQGTVLRARPKKAASITGDSHRFVAIAILESMTFQRALILICSRLQQAGIWISDDSGWCSFFSGLWAWGRVMFQVSRFYCSIF